MPVPTRKERFVGSKCDRCGRATPAKQNGIGDLFTLPDEWGEPFFCQGDFCQRCIDKYPPEDWAVWLKAHGRT
jgi:hypothetical protein